MRPMRQQVDERPTDILSGLTANHLSPTVSGGMWSQFYWAGHMFMCGPLRVQLTNDIFNTFKEKAP